MSEIKVNKISPRSGTDVTLGDSGDTFTLGSGANIAGLTLSDNILFDTASKGIYLGVTSATASNLLDDYEEGDWTPTVGGNATYSVQRGRYYKIGNIVVALYQIQIGVLGTGSVELISGLPFTSENDLALNIRSGYVSYFANLAVSVGSIASYVINNDTSFYFVSTTGDQVTCNNAPDVLGNNAHIYGTVIYNTA